ncbi:MULTISPECIES: hypothetical protein [unclassified Kitasatospora]|uniref:hypothetical protein n=1 Tax=unclassified Kitasatospora TaxID=2633591 RepID=UPI0034011648
MTVVPSGSHARRTAEDPHDGPRRRVGPLAAPDGRLPGAHDLLLMHGAVQLTEYAASPYTLTPLTPYGPREVRDPWFPRGPFG